MVEKTNKLPIDGWEKKSHEVREIKFKILAKSEYYQWAPFVVDN